MPRATAIGLVLAACASGPPTPTVTPSRAGAEPTIAVEVERDTVVFGLVWHDDGWAVATAHTDLRDTVELRPVGEVAFGDAAYAVEIAGPAFPESVVPGDPPWVVFSDRRRWHVMRFDGSDHHVALEIPDQHVGAHVSHDWRAGAPPTLVAGWAAREVREVPEARLREAQRREDARSEETGVIVELSPYRTLAVRARFRAAASPIVDAARLRHPVIRDVEAVAVAAGARHWVGAHWMGTPFRTTVTLNFFHDPTRRRVKRRMVAPRGTRDGHLLASPDGHTFLIVDATSPFGDASRGLLVFTFDRRGARIGRQRIPTDGWVAGNVESFSCGERSWLVFNDQSDAGVETIKSVELRPRGPAPPSIVRWSRRAPSLDGPYSRPVRRLLTACGPHRAAVATLVRRDADLQDGDLLVIAQWQTPGRVTPVVTESL